MKLINIMKVLGIITSLFLLPSISNAQIQRVWQIPEYTSTMIAPPTTGAKIAFRTINNSVFYWNGTVWKRLAGPGIVDTNYTISLASSTISLNGSGTSVDIAPYVSTSPTTIAANYLATSNGTNLVARNLFDNNNTVSILNSKPFQLGQWTTAGRPAGVNGYIGDNSTLGWIERYNSTAGAWIAPAQTAMDGGVFNASYMPYSDANGRLITNSTSGLTYAVSGGNYTHSFVYPSTNNGFVNFVRPGISEAFGFRSLSDGRIFYGWHANGTYISFSRNPVSAQLVGSWDFPINTRIPPAIFALSSGSLGVGSNDVTYEMNKSGNTTNALIYLTGKIRNPSPNTNNNPIIRTAAREHEFYTYSTASVNNSWTGTGDTVRLKILESGRVSIGKTGVANYALDLISNNAFGLARGGVSTRPTIASSTTPFRYNTDSTALEYGESVGTWRLLATREYARLLSSPWLGTRLNAGNVQINANSNDLRIDSIENFLLTSHNTSQLAGAYIGQRAWLNTAKTKYFQRAFMYDSRSGIAPNQMPTYWNLINWNLGAGDNFEWVNGITLDTTNNLFIHQLGGRYGLSYNLFRSQRSAVAGVYLDYARFDFNGTNAAENETNDTYHTRWNKAIGEMMMGLKDGGKFLIAADSTMVFDPAIDMPQFNKAGVGNKEAADLSKTQSNYIAGFATDGTVLDLGLGGGLKKSGGVLDLKRKSLIDSLPTASVAINAGTNDLEINNLESVTFETSGSALIYADSFETDIYNPEYSEIVAGTGAKVTLDNATELVGVTGKVQLRNYGEDLVTSTVTGEYVACVAGISPSGYVQDFRLARDTFIEDVSLFSVGTMIYECQELTITSSMTSTAPSHMEIRFPDASDVLRGKKIIVTSIRKDAGSFVPQIRVVGGVSRLFYTTNTLTTAPTSQSGLDLDGSTWPQFASYEFTCLKINSTDYRWVLKQR